MMKWDFGSDKRIVFNHGRSQPHSSSSLSNTTTSPTKLTSDRSVAPSDGRGRRDAMGEQSFLDMMLSHLRSTFKYYTGYPKELGPSRVVHFTSERQFVQLLHEGRPVVVAFTIKCAFTRHLDKLLEEAAAEFHPHVKFVRVECPKFPGFCITRQKNDYPFIEIFHSPEQAGNQGRTPESNITKYAVKVLPFNYDTSAYGFREFFKRHGIRTSDSS